MAIQIKEFRFEQRGRQLTRAGRAVELRPKAALLLGHLLAHPDRVLSKDELMEAVWGHQHVENQALFQLISELRGRLGDADCIRTFPNRGYQWAWPLQEVDRWRGPKLALVASVALLLGVGWWLSPLDTRQSERPIAAVSPAVDALARAVEARARGDLDSALRHLNTAITEHPRFASAKLELAETLRLQGELVAAQGYAHDALSDSRLANDAYMEVAAHLLLSQLRWQQGDLTGAIELNTTAGKLARERRFSCAAELSTALDRLLLQALTQPESISLPPSLVQQSRLAGCNRSSRLQSPTGIDRSLSIQSLMPSKSSV